MSLKLNGSFYCDNYLQRSCALHVQYTDSLILPEPLFSASLCSCLNFLLADTGSFLTFVVCISHKCLLGTEVL